MIQDIKLFHATAINIFGWEEGGASLLITHSSGWGGSLIYRFWGPKGHLDTGKERNRAMRWCRARCWRHITSRHNGFQEIPKHRGVVTSWSRIQFTARISSYRAEHNTVGLGSQDRPMRMSLRLNALRLCWTICRCRSCNCHCCFSHPTGQLLQISAILFVLFIVHSEATKMNMP